MGQTGSPQAGRWAPEIAAPSPTSEGSRQGFLSCFLAGRWSQRKGWGGRQARDLPRTGSSVRAHRDPGACLSQGRPAAHDAGSCWVAGGVPTRQAWETRHPGVQALALGAGAEAGGGPLGHNAGDLAGGEPGTEPAHPLLVRAVRLWCNIPTSAPRGPWEAGQGLGDRTSSCDAGRSARPDCLPSHRTKGALRQWRNQAHEGVRPPSGTASGSDQVGPGHTGCGSARRALVSHRAGLPRRAPWCKGAGLGDIQPSL